jgi:hypothetical protein
MKEKLDDLVQRVMNYEQYDNWKRKMSEELEEPNELDDEPIEMIDGIKELANFKKSLELHLHVLSKNDFYSHLNLQPFNLVLFYLPCENFSFWKSH